MNMWIYTIEPSLGIIQFEASETRGEHKVAYSEIIYVGFKLRSTSLGIPSLCKEKNMNLKSMSYTGQVLWTVWELDVEDYEILF